MVGTQMLEVFGEYYTIDLDKVTETSELVVELLPPTEPVEGEEDEEEPLQKIEHTINVFKYDIIKQCIDTLLTESGGGDEKMGIFSSDISLPFKFAFNTLIKYGILVKYDNE